MLAVSHTLSHAKDMQLPLHKLCSYGELTRSNTRSNINNEYTHCVTFKGVYCFTDTHSNAQINCRPSTSYAFAMCCLLLSVDTEKAPATTSKRWGARKSRVAKDGFDTTCPR